MPLDTPLRSVRTFLAFVVVAGILLIALAGSAPVASAETLAPWWSVASGARPTNLSGSLGKDEVQQLTVRATKGDVLLAANAETFFEKHAIVPFNASAAQVQEALETKIFSPSRKVIVTGGPGDEKGTKPYEITFPSQSPPIFAIGETEELAKILKEGEALEGEASLSELQKGTPTEDQIVVTAENRGDAVTSGKVTIEDQVPAGFTPVWVTAVAGGPTERNRGPVSCVLKTLTCMFAEKSAKCEAELEEAKCQLPPFEQIEMRIAVVLEPGAKGAQNTATVSGGGASAATASHRIEVGAPQRFGIEDYQLIPEKPGGAIDTQAGSHPFQLTNVVTLNSQTPDSQGRPRTVALPKNIVAELPAGFVGNPTPFAQCTDAQFAAKVEAKEPHGGGNAVINECPAASAIGVSTVTVNEPKNLKFNTIADPIFNMVPNVGEPARFGFKVGGIVPIFLDSSVRAGGDYGVSVGSIDTPEIDWLLSSKLTFWGVPGDPAHNAQRGWDCLQELNGPGACSALSATSPPPFLVMPTSCAAPFESTVRADSWEASGKPSETAEPVTYRLPEAIDGCNHLPFGPEIRVTPDGTAGSSPTGLNVDVHVPQTAVLHAESLAESNVKNIEVVLPPGVAVNPSGADGLQACSEGLAGFTGLGELSPTGEPGNKTPLFTATPKPPFETPEPGLNTCPNASKIGEVTIKSPLLPPGQFVKGFVYLATQNANPFGSLVALYIIAEDPVSGTLIKLPGDTRLTPSGQLIGIFKNNPQLAFEDAELHFFGGERAPLSTPARCGPYTTNATFAPWSGAEPVSSSSTFNITSGPNGSPCTYAGQALPFSPTLTGGATNINAGAFSPFTATFSRSDGEQNMQSIVAKLPPGLSGILAGVELCPEPQANEGKCPPNSLIGESTVSVGVGSHPFTVSGGRFYLTGPYNGTGSCTVGTVGCAPFGITFEVPAKAGPFDLRRNSANPAGENACDCVIVRAKIEIDPITTAITITSDPPGSPYAIPTSIEGIPLQIQHVNAVTTRGNFQFTPTNCAKMEVTGTINTGEGPAHTLGVPFQVTNCALLKFEPKFTASTSGKTSRANGASLTLKVTRPSGPGTGQANFTLAKIELPKQLPSRLTTLQKACTSAQFNANPAGCPPASVIGRVKVRTPILPVPLEGPAIFVSHGGEAFPSVIFVLQGYGVTIDAVSTTFISKSGITSATLKTIPDAPFTSFELSFPEKKYSALAANGNLCKVKGGLKMPTEFVAQNGLKMKQSTKIKVTGCKKVKAAKHHKAHGKHKRKK